MGIEPISFKSQLNTRPLSYNNLFFYLTKEGIEPSIMSYDSIVLPIKLFRYFFINHERDGDWTRNR